MMPLRLWLVLVLAGSAAGVAAAQAPPIKWGDVPDEHLAMTAFPADTNASAVVLADYGEVKILISGRVHFERHRRVKILREAGYRWGDVEVPYYAEDRFQVVSDVRAATYTRGADGSVAVHPMERGAVYDEDVDGTWRRKRFTLPALAPGAVVEYRYVVTSDQPLHLPSWAFQTDEPVLWSEYRAEVPEAFHYVTETIGGHAYAEQTSERVTDATGAHVRHRWAMRDVPALREEPFMTTPRDYRARLDLQLQYVVLPQGGGVLPFMETWEKLAEELDDSPSFGLLLRGSRSVRANVAPLVEGVAEPLERMRAVYDYVRTNVAWNGETGYLADQDPGTVLRTKTASRVETALLLAAMLREADVAADPVLASTRTHGRVQPHYPMLGQFDAVLVRAVVGDTAYLLDATDPLRPYDLLPDDLAGTAGWWVHRREGAWIDLPAESRYTHQTYVTATLGPDGTLTANLQAMDGAYSALYKRRTLKDGGAEKLVREVLLDGLTDVRLDSQRVENADDVAQPLKTQASFTVPAYAQAAGDFLYLNPTLLDRVEENPLKLPERTFPVDFGYPGEYGYTVVMKLPDGYTVQEHPAGLNLATASGGISFRRVVQVREGVLTLQARLVRPGVVFEPDEYAALRDFYDRLVVAGAEQVVLKRITEPAAPAEGGR